jgi:hypothetical protein
MVKWREPALALAVGVLLVLNAQQCSRTAESTLARLEAVRALDSARADRVRLTRLVDATKATVEQKDSTIARLTAKSNGLAATGARRAAFADSLKQRLDAFTEHPVVPNDVYRAALSALDASQQAYQDMAASRELLADSVQRVQRENQRLLVVAIDSVKASLKRDAEREPVIRQGLKPCKWGPIPCLSPKASFAAGAVLTGLAIYYGDDALRALVKR